MLVERVTQQCACFCRATRDGWRTHYAPKSAAKPGCPKCHGTGGWTEVYDREPLSAPDAPSQLFRLK